MQRNTSMWIYFLSLLLAAGMTLALLPACGGGGGGGDSCNSGEPDSEIEETGCELEEVGEEAVEILDEELHGFREETGEPSSEEVLNHLEEDFREDSEEEFCCI